MNSSIYKLDEQSMSMNKPSHLLTNDDDREPVGSIIVLGRDFNKDLYDTDMFTRLDGYPDL